MLCWIYERINVLMMLDCINIREEYPPVIRAISISDINSTIFYLDLFDAEIRT